MHALEIGSAGQVAFASREVPAWHNLGTVFQGEVTTQEMLDLAHLSKWDVRLVDADSVSTSESGLRFNDPVIYVVRTNPFDGGNDVLGVVGGRYKVYQNEDLLGFADNLLDGGRWETAGSIDNGKTVFCSLALDREVVLDPNGASDVISNYLMAMTGHDGKTALLAATTPVRVVCKNTLNFALAGVKQTFKIRHTQKMEGRVQAAREALNLAHTYVDAFEQEAQALIETSMSNAEFFKVVESLYPRPEDKTQGAETRWDNKVAMLGDIFAGTQDAALNAPNTNENIRGTAWAGLNSVTEYLDWYRTARSGNVDNLFVKASGFDTVTNNEKNRINSAFRAFAGL